MEDQIIHRTETPPAGATTSTDDIVSTTVAHPAGTTFPRLLQALRMERGWTKADLAKRSKFDPSTITRLEQGSREPERETVIQLADAMALTAADRDRLLAACGYRSDTWDDPDLVQLAALLADSSIPARCATTSARCSAPPSPTADSPVPGCFRSECGLRSPAKPDTSTSNDKLGRLSPRCSANPSIPAFAMARTTQSHLRQHAGPSARPRRRRREKNRRFVATIR
ncbi:MAG TPA: helix-turn-helix transcriptional regulator [Thermomicrobiales bacterium]|nr:helix-turn-helix transcriptional regulator [Thermomicrobiales bacterium]